MNAYLQVTVTSPSKPPLSMNLGEDEGKVAESLMFGHNPTTVAAIMKVKGLRETVCAYQSKILSDEFSSLCQKKGEVSIFRKISVTTMASNMWKVFISELESKAPTLLHLLTTLVSFNDRRNVSKVGTSHYPSICTAVAVLLKERNREMCGLQSLVSALLYSCHSEKQVSTALTVG